METFNSTNFIKSLKKGYDSISYVQGDQAAKRMVADAIKSSGYNPEDVFSFLCRAMSIPATLNDAEWKKAIDSSIKTDYTVADTLKGLRSVLKKKISFEDMFKTAAACCGKNADLLKKEIQMDLYGWNKAVSALVKTVKEIKEEKKVETGAEKKTSKKVEKKSSIKSDRKDPRCVAIIGIKDGERRVWTSFRACEMDLYNDPKKGHGSVSQFFSGKLKSVKGWTLYKEGEEPKVKVKAPKSTKTSKTKKTRKVATMTTHKHKAVIQLFPDGKRKKWESLTAAAKGTGIPHSSISKAVSGTYLSAGGYLWKEAEA